MVVVLRAHVYPVENLTDARLQGHEQLQWPVVDGYPGFFSPECSKLLRQRCVRNTQEVLGLFAGFMLVRIRSARKHLCFVWSLYKKRTFVHFYKEAGRKSFARSPRIDYEFCPQP